MCPTDRHVAVGEVQGHELPRIPPAAPVHALRDPLGVEEQEGNHGGQGLGPEAGTGGLQHHANLQYANTREGDMLILHYHRSSTVFKTPSTVGRMMSMRHNRYF